MKSAKKIKENKFVKFVAGSLEKFTPLFLYSLSSAVERQLINLAGHPSVTLCRRPILRPRPSLCVPGHLSGSLVCDSVAGQFCLAGHRSVWPVISLCRLSSLWVAGLWLYITLLLLPVMASSASEPIVTGSSVVTTTGTLIGKNKLNLAVYHDYWFFFYQ